MKRTREDSGVFKGAVRLVLAACMAFSLFIDFTLLSENNYQNLAAMTSGHTMALSAATVLFAVLLRWARARFPRRGRGLTALAVFLGAWWVMAQVYANKFRTIELATASQLVKAGVAFVGMSALYDLLLRMLDDVLLRGTDVRVRGGRLRALYRAHPALLCGAAALLCWLPHLLVSYPAAMNNDTANQVEQALGLVPYDGNHPPFGTMVIGWTLALGRALGSVNLGLFAYVVVQSLLGAAVVGYAQATLRKLHAPIWLRALSMGVCAFSPCFCDNVTVILKDVPYTFCALLLCCELARVALVEPPEYAQSIGHVARYGVACMGMLLTRNNGFGLVLPVALGLILRARRAGGGRACLRTGARTLLPVVLAVIVSAGVNAAHDVRPGSIREALSLLFQQTARFVREHGDDIPADERATIDAVLDYDELAGRYDPYISDGVKETLREGVTARELLAYFGVWARQFARDPLCYAQATLIQNALLFDPQTRNVAFFDVVGLSHAGETALGAQKPEALWTLVDREMSLREVLFALPFYPQLTSVGFYAIVMLFCCVVARRERLGGMGLMLVIPVMTAVMIVLGPCLLWQDRYGFPIIYCMPVVLAALARQLNIRRMAGSTSH